MEAEPTYQEADSSRASHGPQDPATSLHDSNSPRSQIRLRRELLALTLGLFIVLILIKARLLPFDVGSIWEFGRWLMRLALVCSGDVLFVTGLSLTCALAGRFSLRWPRLHSCWRASQYLLFYSAAVYAIFAMALFRVTMQPFSIRMLTFVEGPMTMLSSIERYLTWQWLAALILAPLAVLLAPWLLARAASFRWRPRRGADPIEPESYSLGFKGIATVGLILGVYLAASHFYIQRHWTEPRRWERRISSNPHLVLLTSCIEELVKEESWTAIYHGEANEEDFISRRRPPSKERTFNLKEFALSPRPKNVIVLFLESIGAEYLSLYGSKHDTTPHLDKLVAERGVVFDNFYVSAPYSCKSIVALSASVYPRVDWKLIVMDSPEFRVPTITEVLAEHGYRTCYAHSGYWSWRGRDRFLKNRVGTLLDAEHLPGPKISSWGVADRAMFQASLDWIDADPEKPFYLLAYTLETHHPYATPSTPVKFDVEDEDLADYLNAIRATDENIAWLVQELKNRQLLDDTLIVITSDHGEAFGQHNQRSHNFGVYECNVHVPLVMIHPSVRSLAPDQKKGRIRAVREQIDLAPTLLDCLGVKSPSVWQGRNLFRPEDGRPTYFYCIGNFVVLGLRDGPFKYHYYMGSGQEELFNVEADPGELNNLASAHADRCRDYRKRVGGLVRYQRRFLAEQGSP